MRADRQPCHGLESRGRRDGPELPDLYPEQVAWAARDDFDRLRKDLETRSIIVNYANNARKKRKAPPGGRRGFESLAGFGGWGRDPCQVRLTSAQMVNRSKNFLACPPSHTHHFLNGREALAGSGRASSPAPKQMDSLSLLDQLSQLLAGIKHAGLHGGGRDVE